MLQYIYNLVGMYCKQKLMKFNYDRQGFNINVMTKRDFLELQVESCVKVYVDCERHCVEITKIVYYKNGRSRKPKKMYGRITCCELENNDIVFHRDNIDSLSGFCKCYCTDRRHKQNFPQSHRRFFSITIPDGQYQNDKIEKYLEINRKIQNRIDDNEIYKYHDDMELFKHKLNNYKKENGLTSGDVQKIVSYKFGCDKEMCRMINYFDLYNSFL